MFKILRDGVIGVSIIIGLTGCQSELSNEELKGLKACHTTQTGISIWSNSILEATRKMKNAGVGVTVLKDGSELVLDLGDDAKIVLEEIDYKDSSCYEIQSIQGDKGELSKGNGDNFLVTSAMFFGRLSATDRDKEKKASRENLKLDKLKVLNQKLESAKMDVQSYEIFLNSFNMLESKYNFDGSIYEDKPILSKDALYDLKELLNNNTNYDKSGFKEFISYIDGLFEFSDEQRAENNTLQKFSYKYSRVKSDVEGRSVSDMKYEITTIQDEIDDVNVRY